MSSGSSSQVVGLLLRRADEVLDVVEVDAGQVGTPGRHGLLVEELEALEAVLQHPLGLALQAGDVADDLFGQPAPGGGARRRWYPPSRSRIGRCLRGRSRSCWSWVVLPGAAVRRWCRPRRRGRWWRGAGHACRAGGRTPRSRPRTTGGTARRRGPPGSGAGRPARRGAAGSGSDAGGVAVGGQGLGQRCGPVGRGGRGDGAPVARLELGDPALREGRRRRRAPAVSARKRRAPAARSS